jgi:hypothetical protein
MYISIETPEQIENRLKRVIKSAELKIELLRSAFLNLA